MDRDEIRRAAIDPDQIATRMSLARFTSNIFQSVGNELHVTGILLEPIAATGFRHLDMGTTPLSQSRC